MGTTGIKQTAEETRQMLLRDFHFDRADGKFSHVVASAKGRGVFWVLCECRYQEVTEGPFIESTVIICVKMSSAGGWTYYKEMDISCHPLYYDCPKSWLDRVTISGKYAEEWLENARAYHSKQNKIGKGMQFTYMGVLYELEKYYGGGYWVVIDLLNGGRRYKMSSKNIRRGEVIHNGELFKR